MKAWILKTFFKKTLANTMREASIDAFKKAHADILETHVVDVKEEATKKAQELVDAMFSIVDPSLIVSLEKTADRITGIQIGGIRADQARLMNLRSEAELIRQTDLWKILNETTKELAMRAMFKDDGTLDNLLLKGRIMLYTLQTQSKNIDLFAGLSPTDGSG